MTGGRIDASRTIRHASITPRDLEHMLCDENADPKALPFSLLEEITDCFSDEKEIGRGAFAVVYKGKLDNRTVAVKKMSIPYKYEKEFCREVECLITVKHNNIVRFLGYCADTQGTIAKHGEKIIMADVQQRLLCFEYLPKGSLRDYITDASHEPRWRHCYELITGICQGLHYLHQKKIAHLDLKPENILLDDNLVAKITDFGLSRCFIGETDSRVISNIGGTRGYWAPETVGNHTQFTNRDLCCLDIYSLGVVILEILSGKNCYLIVMEIHTGKQEYYHAVDNVVERWSNMVEQSQRDELLEQVRVCAEIGIACINFNPANRPDTQRIINRLDGKETMDDNINTGLVTSRQVENAPNEQHQGMPNSLGETSSNMVECRSETLEESHCEIQLKQVQVCAEVGIECSDFSPANRPDTQHIIESLGETENMDEYSDTDVITTHQLVQKELVFTVKDEPWFKLKQLRDLNNLHGSLVIDGLENVKSREEALEANLAAKERLTELELKWDSSSTRRSPEVEADVLDGLCPPMGLKNLKISFYKGSRYPEWMVVKQNGGPKDLQELHLRTFVIGPPPQIVEVFPHLRVLWLSGGTWDGLPSNMEHLTSLKKLVIVLNKSIRSLPTLPRSLEEIQVYLCDQKFMKSCQTVGHPNWHQIEHIPKKEIDNLSFVERMVWKIVDVIQAFGGRTTT